MAGDLGPRHSFVAGVLVVDGAGRVLCAPHGREHWIRRGAELLIGLGAIGGGMERGERPHETARREALEEIGCRVALSDSRLTYVVDAAGRLRAVRYPERPAPALIFWRPVRRRYAPWPPLSDRFYGLMYRARVRGAPRLAAMTRSKRCSGFPSLSWTVGPSRRGRLPRRAAISNAGDCPNDSDCCRASSFACCRVSSRGADYCEYELRPRRPPEALRAPGRRSRKRVACRRLPIGRILLSTQPAPSAARRISSQLGTPGRSCSFL